MSQQDLSEREDAAVRAFVKLGFTLAESYAHAGCMQKWLDGEVEGLAPKERDLFKEMMEALR